MGVCAGVGVRGGWMDGWMAGPWVGFAPALCSVCLSAPLGCRRAFVLIIHSFNTCNPNASNRHATSSPGTAAQRVSLFGTATVVRNREPGRATKPTGRVGLEWPVSHGDGWDGDDRPPKSNVQSRPVSPPSCQQQARARIDPFCLRRPAWECDSYGWMEEPGKRIYADPLGSQAQTTTDFPQRLPLLSSIPSQTFHSALATTRARNPPRKLRPYGTHPTLALPQAPVQDKPKPTNTARFWALGSWVVAAVGCQHLSLPRNRSPPMDPLPPTRCTATGMTHWAGGAQVAC